jgi:N-acetylmuramoyl-L-alanine amidase
MNEVTPTFKELVRIYAALPIHFPQLKAVTVAQWLLESARGNSRLATEHFNFSGLKFRPEMAQLATKVAHTTTHDGTDFYCRFASLENFAKGYWRFIARDPYKGFENHAGTGEDYIRFIGPIYAPGSASPMNPGYADKVLSLIGEATALLQAAGGNVVDKKEDVTEEPVITELTRTVVLDPGHGGRRAVGGSSANNATSFSGVLEKKMTLDLGRLIRTALEQAAAADPGLALKVVMTRDSDINLGLADRANVARDNGAQVFVSLHFNGFNKQANGVETLIFPRASGNVNFEEDRGLARRIQEAMLRALRQHRPATIDRGVKEQSLGVLRDVSLGNSMSNHPCRACLLEGEFIDVREVDKLLNTSAEAPQVRQDLANAIAGAIIADLKAHG